MTVMNVMRPATMEEDHALLLEAMKYIDDICRKENITYYAAYGTLLGAVREHGFIAWDYDADLWMKRKDYEKFIEASKNYPNPKYFLQTVDTDKGYFLPLLMKVCINDTSCWPPCYWNAQFHTGFHVDIFPLDYGFGSAEKNRKKLRILQFLHLHIFYRFKDSLKDNLKCVRSLKKLVGFIFKDIPCKMLSLRQWINIYRKIVSNYSPDKNILISTGGCYEPEHEIFNAELFDEVTELQFEDMMIKCPAGYDELLTQIYGNYMQPCEEENVMELYVKA